jgi:O-antigen/teichoic acid export membrane protein
MIKRLLANQLRINMVSGVMTTVINTAVVAAAFPLYLHFLGYEKYGVWLVLATVLTFVQLGNLGIDQAIMKLVAEEYGRKDIDGIQRYVATAMALLGISGVIVLAIILIFKTPIIAAFKLSGENAGTALWLLPYVGLLSIYVFMVQTVNATLCGLGRMDIANYIQSAGKVIGVVASAILLYVGRGIESLLIASVLSYVFINIASLFFIRRIANIGLLSKIREIDAYGCKCILRFGGGVFGSSLISMFLSPFNKLMLSRYVGVSAVPIYEIAYSGSMQVRALIEVGFRALMPEVSRLSADATHYGKEKIAFIYRYAMKIIFLLGVPMYGILALFAPLLLRIWLGDRCVEALPAVFRIMLIATFLSLVGVPAYYTLIGFGRVRDIMKTNIISAGGNLVLVIAYYVVIGSLSIHSIAWCVAMANVMPLAYILYKTRHLYDSDIKPS